MTNTQKTRVEKYTEAFGSNGVVSLLEENYNKKGDILIKVETKNMVEIFSVSKRGKQHVISHKNIKTTAI
jgi:hypothetical protein